MLTLIVVGCGNAPPPSSTAATGQGGPIVEASSPASASIGTSAPTGASGSTDGAAAPGPIEAFREAAPGVYSGGEPKTRAAFEKLKNAGVKTLVSVDGQQPNVELAHEFGMTYVHIPLGYDGIPPEAQLALAEVMNTSPRPLFIHCHHGKHRGPAATAIACRTAGLLNAAEAKTLLESSGTSRDYHGLWRDVEGYQPAPADAPKPALMERAKVSAMQSAMAMLDRAFDRLKLAQKAGWSGEAAKNLDPRADAVLAVESFTESLRDASDEELKRRLTEAKRLAEELQTALAGDAAEAKDAALKKLDASCKACHKAHRD